MKKVLGIILFTALTLVLTACGTTSTSTTTTISTTAQMTWTTPENMIGLVTLELYDGTGTRIISEPAGFTAEDTLLGLLMKTLGVVCQGEDGGHDDTCSFTGPYGIYVMAVGQVTAYESNQYIAFYIDGAYATTGIGATPLVAGSVYAFKLETF